MPSPLFHIVLLLNTHSSFAVVSVPRPVIAAPVLKKNPLPVTSAGHWRKNLIASPSLCQNSLSRKEPPPNSDKESPSPLNAISLPTTSPRRVPYPVPEPKPPTFPF